MRHRARRYDDFLYESSLSVRTERTGARERTKNHSTGRGSGVGGLSGGVFGRAWRAGPSRARPQRLSTIAVGVDGGRPGPGFPDAGQVRRGPVFSLGTVAAVFEEGEASGGDIAVAVPEGNIDERLRWGAHTFPRHLGGEVPKSRRIPGEGSGGTARLLRLPCGALAEPPDDEPHRIDLRHDTFANGGDQELPE